MHHVLLPVLPVLLLLASCGGGADAPWAQGALDYVHALDAASERSIPAVLRFYAPDAVLDGEANLGAAAIGRERIGEVLVATFGPTIDEARFGVAFVDTTGVVIQLRYVAPELPGGSSDGVMVRELEAGGLATTEDHASSVVSIGPLTDPYTQVYGFDLDPEVRQARLLADRYLHAWSSGEGRELRGLYAPDVHLVDALEGVELRGASAVASYATALRTERGPAALRLRELGADRGPAVYIRWPAGPVDMHRHRFDVYVVHTVESPSRCSADRIVGLTVSDGRVVRERRYHEIESFRGCHDRDPLPTGWWSDLEQPPPARDEVTGVIEVGEQETEVHNGTAALERLTSWAFERFAAAGLGEPAVDVVAFDDDAHAVQCADRRHGLALDVGETTQLYLCFDEEQACADDDCGAFRLRIRQLMLHELGHAWLNDHVGEATQRDFLERMGIEQWRDESIPWEQRGVEQAANVLAWGVTDEQIDTTGDRSCVDLSAAFELLTGERPQQPCGRADPP